MTRGSAGIRIGASPDIAAGKTDARLVFPLTPMQLGLIYESNLTDRPWNNLEQIVIRFDDEPFDLAAMTAAWRSLVARHDALRSVILLDDLDKPLQAVEPKAGVSLETVDISGRPPEIQEETLRDWLGVDRTKGVDLETAPNWRLTWFLLAERKSILVWTFHHCILDGRSFTTLLKEVLDHYGDLRDRRTNVARLFKMPKARFADHCRALGLIDTQGAQRHFQSLLEDFDTPNKIDIRSPWEADGGSRTADAVDRKQLVERVLPRSFGHALREKAEAAGVTVATLVLAAWGLVVARTSNREDAVFGVTRSGRHLISGARDIAGCLISTTPQRISLGRSVTIDDLITTVRRDQLAVRTHEHISLTDLPQWSDQSNGNALFETAVVFERGSLNAILRMQGGDWAKRRFDVLEEGTLPLTLAVYDDDEMLFRLEYSPKHFTADVAKRLLGYTLNALEGFASLPGDTPLQKLEMLPLTETAALLSLGRPDSPARKGAVTSDCVVRALSNSASMRSAKTALTQAGKPEGLTYRELTEMSDGIARLLRTRGAKPDKIVAVCLPRSFEFVAAMLAVMKTGAAFLPVDPTYPQQVIDHMMRDSGADLIVSECASVPNHVKDVAILLDTDGKQYEGQSFKLPGVDPDPGRTAYVIYTSGSTGVPKGVAVSHRSLARYSAAITEAYDLRATDRILQFASLSFDVSIEEIIPTLLSGAELVLRSPEMADSMAALLEETEALGITVLNLPTAFWHALVDHIEDTGARLPASIRLVIAGGEAVAPTALARWRKLVPDVRWQNSYGPTEATITTTVFDPDKSDPLGPEEDVPIGRPLGHTRAYVLTPDGSLAPWGARGELWLGGPAVAKGYLKRPELTAERFLPDPFVRSTTPSSTDPRKMMYRTGDVARWFKGQLSFGGRVDRQVKVNGYRIELREVEKALETRPGIGLALAAADRSGEGTTRLLAWVTPKAGVSNLDRDEIQDDLRRRLPGFMVPRVVVVEDFPKTPAGKVDVAALPRPEATSRPLPKRDQGGESVRRIRQIFVEILSAQDVGPDESFFDLGGHSLLAVRLIGRIEKDFGRRLSVSELHQGSTPRLISRRLERPDDKPKGELILPIQPNGTRPPIFGVHVLGTKECFFRPLADALGADQPLFGVSVGPLTADSPTGVVETAALYRENIEAHHPEGPICLTAVSQGSFIAFELAQQLIEAGRDVAVLALFDAAGPGGRPRLQGAARVSAHLHQLLRLGPRYLGTIACNRLENLRNAIEKTRIQMASSTGRPGGFSPTVESFVAANTLAIEAYQAKCYPGRLTVFRAMESAFDSPNAVASGGLGWRQVAGGGFDLIEVPGGHLSMLEPPHVHHLAKKLRELINQAVEPSDTARLHGSDQ
ncbi:MAG: amino acid adenylation domain-containing protein [Rhodobacter sp.]|nr:amino acid adenylation domain-containing protein [Rhodobacter sp.]